MLCSPVQTDAPDRERRPHEPDAQREEDARALPVDVTHALAVDEDLREDVAEEVEHAGGGNLGGKGVGRQQLHVPAEGPAAAAAAAAAGLRGLGHARRGGGGAAASVREARGARGDAQALRARARIRATRRQCTAGGRGVSGEHAQAIGVLCGLPNGSESAPASGAAGARGAGGARRAGAPAPCCPRRRRQSAP